MGAKIVPVNFFDAEHCSDLAVSPAAATNFPVTNLQSNARDTTWRSADLSAVSITGSFGGNARRVSFWGLWAAAAGSSLIGAQVRVRHWSDAAKTTVSYDSGTLNFWTPTGENYNEFAWGAHPWNCEHGDRTSRLAPKARFHSAVSSSAFQIDITNAGAIDTSYFEARRLWIGDYVEAPYNAGIGAAPQWRSSSQHQRSIGGALRRLVRAVWREMRCEIALNSEAHRKAWSDLCHVAEPGKEIVFSLFEEADGERRFRDHIVLGSLEVLNPAVWENLEFWKLQLAIVES